MNILYSILLQITLFRPCLVTKKGPADLPRLLSVSFFPSFRFILYDLPRPTALFAAGGRACSAALFGVNDAPKPVDDALFKRAPKSVKALNLLARKEARQRARAAWAAANPERIPKR